MELFVTDLDGTFLNKESVVSKKSELMINELLANGVQFTVATARTHATVIDVLAKLNLTLPIVLMNGVGIYDLSQRTYLEIVAIPNKSVRICLDIFSEEVVHPLLYNIDNDNLVVYYEQLVTHHGKQFYEDRKDKPFKTFKQVPNIATSLNNGEIVNILLFDDTEVIARIKKRLDLIFEVTATAYEIDAKNKRSYLEVHSVKASKANGIKALMKYVSYDKLVVFGDNLNDIPMFELADESIATRNACEALKKHADEVIDDHHVDAVATYLIKRCDESRIIKI